MLAVLDPFADRVFTVWNGISSWIQILTNGTVVQMDNDVTENTEHDCAECELTATERAV